MKSTFKYLMVALMGMALCLAGSGQASAAPITGSDGFASIGTFAIPGGSNIATSTAISATFVLSTNVGNGDYNVIAPGTLFGTQTLTWASLNTYTLNLTESGPPGTNYGTFGGVISATVVSRTAFAFEVDFIGTFTPGPGIPGVGPNNQTTLIVTGNDATGTGLAVTESLSLTSPAQQTTPTPEPSTLVLACLAGVPFAVGRFRRWGRKNASQEPLTV